MDKKQMKAIRLMMGFNDDLRVKLPYSPRTITPAHDAVTNFILDNLIGIYGCKIYDMLGTVNTKDVKVREFASNEARAVLLGEAE